MFLRFTAIKDDDERVKIMLNYEGIVEVTDSIEGVEIKDYDGNFYIAEEPFEYFEEKLAL